LGKDGKKLGQTAKDKRLTAKSTAKIMGKEND
jgi:hypothetical protein